MKKYFVLSLLLCFCLCAAYAQAGDKEYVISKGDTLFIQVWGEDSLSASVVVRPDGRISLPGIGTLQAAGLTSTQLQHRVAAKLSELVYEPMVTVMVQSFLGNNIVVHGPGVQSHMIVMTGKTTVLSVLAQVAPDNSADLVNAWIQRDGEIIARNFDELYRKGAMVEDIELLSGDRLFIPLRQGRLVYVDGAVNTPSSLVHYDGMTILEAINQAGGFTKFADKNDTIIFRQGAAGKERIRVRLEDFLDEGDFSQNIPVEGGDLIVVKKCWF